MSTDVPEPISADEKEVFAFYGLAAYRAQVLEQEVLLFAVSLRLIWAPEQTADLVEQLFSTFDPQTLGRVLSACRDLVDFPDDLATILDEALSTRNRRLEHPLPRPLRGLRLYAGSRHHR